MKVTEKAPVIRTFTVEMTQEELERLYYLSVHAEGNHPEFPASSSGRRLMCYVPKDVASAAISRFKGH